MDPSTVFVEKQGAQLGELSPRPAPRPSFGTLGQKVEIFDRSPLPVPFDTTVPFCPLVGEPGAVLLDGRGLVGSSSELFSWIGLLILAVLVVGLAETVLKAPLAAILESKMTASTLPVAILD